MTTISRFLKIRFLFSNTYSTYIKCDSFIVIFIFIFFLLDNK